MRPATLLLLVLVVATLAACSGGDTAPEATPTPSDGRGGGMPPYYEESVVLTEGDYLPSDFFDKLGEEGIAAANADARKPDFEGSVAGVRLYSFEHTFRDPSVERKQCVVGKFREADGLKFTYLPGGTSARGPQFAGVCEGEEVAFIMQEFNTKHGGFQVGFHYGEAAFGHDASAERVRAEKIGEHEGVVISPVVADGFGRGWAAYATKNGIVWVDGNNLPTTELVKIAGGVECSVC